jgi:hypothetical protein
MFAGGDSAKKLARSYQRECCGERVESSFSTFCATDYVLDDYLDDKPLGPYLKFEGVAQQSGSKVWHGSILIGTWRAVVDPRLYHTCVQSCPGPNVVKAWPQLPIARSGEYVGECYGYSFWQFSLRIQMDPEHRLECTYFLDLHGIEVPSEAKYRFWIAAGCEREWKAIRSPIPGPLQHDWPLGGLDWRGRRDMKILLHVVPPDFVSPFFLDNKTRFQQCQEVLATVPYLYAES